MNKENQYFPSIYSYFEKNKGDISQKYQDIFWFSYPPGILSENRRKGYSKKTPWFYQEGNRTKEPCVVSPSQLGVIRSFNSYEEYQRGLQIVENINKICLEHSFSKFNFHPTKILTSNPRIFCFVEKVYFSPNLIQVISGDGPDFNSLYGDYFYKRLKRRDIEFNDIFPNLVHDLVDSHFELSNFVNSHFIGTDIQERSNILCHDYDPVTRKPLLGIIDHGGAIRSSSQIRKLESTIMEFHTFSEELDYDFA